MRLQDDTSTLSRPSQHIFLEEAVTQASLSNSPHRTIHPYPGNILLSSPHSNGGPAQQVVSCRYPSRCPCPVPHQSISFRPNVIVARLLHVVVICGFPGQLRCHLRSHLGLLQSAHLSLQRLLILVYRRQDLIRGFLSRAIGGRRSIGVHAQPDLDTVPLGAVWPHVHAYWRLRLICFLRCSLFCRFLRLFRRFLCIGRFFRSFLRLRLCVLRLLHRLLCLFHSLLCVFHRLCCGFGGVINSLCGPHVNSPQTCKIQIFNNSTGGCIAAKK
ncbi:hypothetical protein Vretimale_10090 [Volvox reticuliferus]|uniref:Uncharacterized protein n=1 Tax=Volvox reticuliferus TaxID=1737510 RepID=A0A8J4GEQ9_9CHLO|nr:hypothetical protein Vretimale_10090 [Volvox reticuliferus]